MPPVLGILVRATGVYVFLLIVLRLTGKRTIGEGTPFDLVVALILGDLLDNLVWGQAPAAQGITALGSLVVLHLVVVTLGFWSPRFDRLVGSGTTVLIRRGEVLREGLRREHMNDADLTAALRSASTPDAGDVSEARLEATGQVSVLRRDPARPADRRDLAGLATVLRQR